jgi:hypothetical protein
VKRTVSAVEDGADGIGGKAVWEGVLLIKILLLQDLMQELGRCAASLNRSTDSNHLIKPI